MAISRRWLSQLDGLWVSVEGSTLRQKVILFVLRENKLHITDNILLEVGLKRYIICAIK